jgi:hypothetical protein
MQRLSRISSRHFLIRIYEYSVVASAPRAAVAAAIQKRLLNCPGIVAREAPASDVATALPWHRVVVKKPGLPIGCYACVPQVKVGADMADDLLVNAVW